MDTAKQLRDAENAYRAAESNLIKARRDHSNNRCPRCHSWERAEVPDYLLAPGETSCEHPWHALPLPNGER